MKRGPRKYYKSIDFDLDTVKLSSYYKDYRYAYRDIAKFMDKHRFFHRQGSVYNSIDKLSESNIIDLVDDLMDTFEWAADCIKAFDVTNIGEQHSMLDQIKSSGNDIPIDLNQFIDDPHNIHPIEINNFKDKIPVSKLPKEETSKDINIDNFKEDDWKLGDGNWLQKKKYF